MRGTLFGPDRLRQAPGSFSPPRCGRTIGPIVRWCALAVDRPTGSGGTLPRFPGPKDAGSPLRKSHGASALGAFDQGPTKLTF